MFIDQNPNEEKDDVILKYLAIFYLMTLTWTLTGNNGEIISIKMEARVLRFGRHNG